MSYWGTILEHLHDLPDFVALDVLSLGYEFGGETGQYAVLFAEVYPDPELNSRRCGDYLDDLKRVVEKRREEAELSRWWWRTESRARIFTE